jgi:hypothetical protein
MATSLLLAAPLCFRRHGSTPFHQQPDDASSRLQFRSLVAAYQPRAVRSIDFFSCAQMSSAARSPLSTRRRRGATSSRSRESSSLITWRCGGRPRGAQFPDRIRREGIRGHGCGKIHIHLSSVYSGIGADSGLEHFIEHVTRRGGTASSGPWRSWPRPTT